MHANKIRPVILSELQRQINQNKIDRLPEFEVTKIAEADSPYYDTEAFQVTFKREMWDTSAYDVDSIQLHKTLEQRFDKSFKIIQPF